MRPICLLFVSLLVAGLRLPAGEVSPAPGVAPVPTVEALISNVIARVAWVKQQNVAGQYTYTRTRTMEDFDDQGRLKDSQEKTFRFFPLNGFPFARLISVNGKPLSAKELKAEQEREQKARTVAAAGGRPALAAEVAPKKEYALTPDMFDRFRFTVTGREQINGRDAWRVTFAPRGKDLPINGLKDRVINNLSGRIWIDAEEYELVRSELMLTAPVSLVGGIVGTLRKFDYSLHRVRAEGGAWFVGRSQVQIEGREVVRNRHVRVRVEEKEVQRVATPADAASRPTVAGGDR